MRPVELALAGFTAYRDHANIDFRDADLFALTGPTGSGKSSIVDAIVFALYGTVPRYGDRRSVEPVVSLGKNEARVRFDFTVGDDSYSVARVVRRTKNGATTAEARLEHDGTPLASGADEVTGAVENLLGLSYDHFIKAVVLPQGEFSRFLHDKPRDRQELLRELLDLHVYRKIRDLAVGRKNAAELALAGHRKETDLLADLAGRDQKAATEHVERLVALREAVIDAQNRIAAREAELTVAAKQIHQERETLTALDIRRPDGLDDLVRRIADADRAVDEARTSADKAFAALDLHEHAIESLPEPATLEAQIEKTRLRSELAKRVESATKAAVDGRDGVRQLRDQMGAAQRALVDARDRMDRLRRSHAAHELASSLEVGEPCPVCGAPVTTLPAAGPVVDIENAEAEVGRSVAAYDAAQQAVTHAEVAHATAQAHLDELAAQVASIERELEGVPSVVELTKRLSEAHTVRAKLAELKAAVGVANAAVKAAEQQQASLSSERATARADFQSARDRVAKLEPPPASMDDLAFEWTSLVEWAVAKKAEVTLGIGDLEARVKQLSEQSTEAADTLRALQAELPSGLSPDEALFAARKELDEIREAKERTKALAVHIETEQERSRVAAALAKHLHSNRFESWMLEEALVELTVGANERLDDLSGGAYSLEASKTGFTIIDHRNADQQRSVRTLSGGETFIVSLALALSLSEQLAALSLHGTSKLESIFLDEGFGSLDQETLDVVASVVQELGATGLTVGVISHVPDLAEQVPTRYVVTKDATGAHVERVDA